MSLLKSASLGAMWMLASGVGAHLVQLLQIVILARILTPADFGAVAILVVFIVFAQLVSDLGFGNAIIHKQDVSRNSLSSLYWLNITAGLLIFSSFKFLSPWLVAFYNEPILYGIIDYAALIFLIVPIGNQFKILLQKNLEFRLIAMVEVSSSISGFVVAVLMAFLGFGALSIISGLLMKNCFASITLLLIGWHNGWLPIVRFRVGDVKEYIGFSSYQLAEKIVKFINLRSAHLIIGYMLGAQALGYYFLAFNFTIIPLQMICAVFVGVAFPVFSKIQNNDEMLRRGYFFVLKLLSMVNMPALMVYIVVAPVFILLVFGEQWNNAVFPMQVLCIVSILQYISNTTNPILLAKGRADLAFKWNLSIMVLQVPLLIIGAYYYGVAGVVVSFFVSQLISTSLSYLLLNRVLINLRPIDYLMSILPFFVMSFVVMFVTWLTGHLLGGENIEVFILQIISSIALYVVMVFIFRRSFFNEVKKIVLNR